MLRAETSVYYGNFTEIISKFSIKRDSYKRLIQKEKDRVNSNMMRSIYSTLNMNSRLISVADKNIYLIVNRVENTEHFISEE